MLSRGRRYALALREIVQRISRNSLFRGGAMSLLIQSQFMVVQLVTGIVLARTLGPDDFGVYSFAFAVVSFIQIMPRTGLDNAVVRYSAQYRAQRSWSMLGGLWRMAIIASIIYGLLSAATVIGIFSLGWLPTTAALSPPVLAVAAIPMMFLPLMTFLGAALRAVSSTVVGQLPQFAVRPWVNLMVVLTILMVSSRALTAEVAMCAQGIAACATTVIGFYWLLKYRPEQLTKVRRTYDTKRWLRSVAPLCLAGGLMLINTQADVLMLGILGSAHETGLYKVAASGANLVVLSLTAANLLIAPRISAMYTRGELVRLQRLLSLSSRSTFVVALSVAGVFWLWGAGLLGTVFGAEYRAAFWPLAILCVGQLINVGAGPVGLVLSMTGHEADAARMAGAAAVINIALNLVLIPKFGGVGAATSTGITMFVWNGLMLISVRNRTGLGASIFGCGAISET